LETQRLLTLLATRERTAIGKTTLYAMMAAGTFPRPVKVGRRSLWVESEVAEWIADRVAEREDRS